MTIQPVTTPNRCEGRYVVEIQPCRFGFSGTYTYTDYGGWDLAPRVRWWRPTRHWIERKMEKVSS